jgi:two-component system NtrC family sensor kinase
MLTVKIGTRLTAVLLLALTPVLIGYMYWSVSRSTVIYMNDLRRELRATAISLAPSMENDLLEREWDQVEDVLRRMSRDGIAVAVLTREGRDWYAPAGFPRQLAAIISKANLSDSNATEFEKRIGAVDWFCAIVPLKNRGQTTFGYLLVAQDWTDIRGDLRDRTIGSIFTALIVIGLIIAIIPLAVARYVSQPLAELSRRVAGFPDSELGDRVLDGDEVSLLTEEFRRLDDQLNNASRELLLKHRRELDLERRLQHAERLATIGTLASGLAHEIGTPMGVIRGRAEYLLHSESTTAKTRDGLEIIISQIDRVSRIVRMLLDYGRRRESQRAVCDARSIVNHALSLMETEAARRDVQISTALGDKPLMIECDSGQLQQVCINLIMNALDAMTPSGGTLDITAKATGGAAPSVTIDFIDTGHGVPSQYSSRVFDPFFTTKEPGSGTGMGLAVSQSIVRDHNGEIDFESRPEGSRFFVTLPLAPLENATTAKLPAPAEHLT